MAVRDDQQSGPRDQTSPALPWKDLFDRLPAIVVVGGLLLYGFLNIHYEMFYSGLGVDPNDVGLSYAGTLARSSGFVYACITVAVSVMALRQFRREESSPWVRRAYSLAMVLLVAVVVLWPSYEAARAANAVKAGMSVRPTVLPLPFSDFPVLSIHADPVTVGPNGKRGESPATDRLRNAKLLYLGQAGGTVVLYSPPAQRAVTCRPARSSCTWPTATQAHHRTRPAQRLRASDGRRSGRRR